MTKLHVLALAALITAAGPTCAAPPDAPAPAPSSPQAFQDADSDGDGRLDEAEFKNYVSGHGAEAEAPGQGMPATEHQAQTLRNFKDEDINGDGYVSADELTRSR